MFYRVNGEYLGFSGSCLVCAKRSSFFILFFSNNLTIIATRIREEACPEQLSYIKKTKLSSRFDQFLFAIYQRTYP